MHQFIESADDVVALTVAEKITNADLTSLMDVLEARMARHEKVHMFVETQGIDGVELAGLAAHVARAMPLFGKLRQFERIAVVADQAWVRAGTRVESAMLPFVRYRVFRPEHRDEALAWVAGDALPD